MLPDNTLSADDPQLITEFLGGRALVDEITLLTDVESGGIALQDPTEGLQFQFWRARVSNNSESVLLKPDNAAEFTVFTGSDIAQISITFDQNMQIVLAYVDAEGPKLFWFDPIAEALVSKAFPTTMESPRVTLDDKRQKFLGGSDVILAYLEDGDLYYRQQRDRYDVPILLATDVYDPEGPPTYIRRVGMNIANRLQFEIFRPWTADEQLAYTLSQAPDSVSQGSFGPGGTTSTILTPSSPTIWDKDNDEEA